MTTRWRVLRHFVWRSAATSLHGWSGWLALIALADLITPK
jgi:hypothetical protein